MTKVITLLKGINAHITYIAPVAIGSDLFRVIYEIYQTEPKKDAGKIFKHYEIWVTRDYVEDSKRLKHGATEEEIIDFTHAFLRKRFRESGDSIPVEDGAFITNTTGIMLGNPRTFPLKVPNRPRLLKTTILLPEDIHKWLKDYAHQNNIGLGEAIRRIVMSFQKKSEHQKR